MTEGARVTLGLCYLHCNALSLSRLRRQLPHGGSLWLYPLVFLLFIVKTVLKGTAHLHRLFFLVETAEQALPGL